MKLPGHVMDEEWSWPEFCVFVVLVAFLFAVVVVVVVVAAAVFFVCAAASGHDPDPRPTQIYNNINQMIITRPSEGLRSSSRAYPIQVDRPGTSGTVSDPFRLVPEDFLLKLLTF